MKGVDQLVNSPEWKDAYGETMDFLSDPKAMESMKKQVSAMGAWVGREEEGRPVSLECMPPVKGHGSASENVFKRFSEPSVYAEVVKLAHMETDEKRRQKGVYISLYI